MVLVKFTTVAAVSPPPHNIHTKNKKLNIRFIIFNNNQINIVASVGTIKKHTGCLGNSKGPVIKIDQFS